MRAFRAAWQEAVEAAKEAPRAPLFDDYLLSIWDNKAAFALVLAIFTAAGFVFAELPSEQNTRQTLYRYDVPFSYDGETHEFFDHFSSMSNYERHHPRKLPHDLTNTFTVLYALKPGEGRISVWTPDPLGWTSFVTDLSMFADQPGATFEALPKIGDVNAFRPTLVRPAENTSYLASVMIWILAGMAAAFLFVRGLRRL